MIPAGFDGTKGFLALLNGCYFPYVNNGNGKKAAQLWKRKWFSFSCPGSSDAPSQFNLLFLLTASFIQVTSVFHHHLNRTLRTIEELTNTSALSKNAAFPHLCTSTLSEPSRLLTVRLGGRPGVFAGVSRGMELEAKFWPGIRHLCFSGFSSANM